MVARPLNSTCNFSTSVTVVARPLNSTCSFSTSVTVVARPLNSTCSSSTSVTVVARPLNSTCSSSTSVTVVARPLNSTCSSSTSVTVVARPLRATGSFSPSVMANTHNEACISSPTVNLMASPLSATCVFSHPTTCGSKSEEPLTSFSPTSSSSAYPSHQVASTAAWWEGCEGMSSGTTSPPPSPTSVATSIFQLSPQTYSREVPFDALSPCSWTSTAVNLSISNSASSSVVNLTYLPNLTQELVSTIIALRFPRLRKRRLTYKRSCCGQYWHIIDLSLPPVYLPRARGAVLPPSPPSPPILLPLEGVVDVSRSSSRMVACQSPIRGHDPG